MDGLLFKFVGLPFLENKVVQYLNGNKERELDGKSAKFVWTANGHHYKIICNMLVYMYFESIWIAYEHIKDRIIDFNFDDENSNMDWGILSPLARIVVRYVIHGYIRRSFGTINKSKLPKYSSNERHDVIEDMKSNSRQSWYLSYLYAHELVCCICPIYT